jgi:hypothetical protein
VQNQRGFSRWQSNFEVLTHGLYGFDFSDAGRIQNLTP